MTRSTVHRFALSALLAVLVSTHMSAQGDDEWSRWTSGRYRITPGDVLEVSFPFVPELNQTFAVQPDGYVSLKELPDMRIQGRTVEQVKLDLLEAYGAFVRDPVLTVTLKESQAPYIVAGGEVNKPGRYDLRGPMSLTEALALAGGPVRGANLKTVVLFRRTNGEQMEAKKIDVSHMYAKHDLSEDLLLRPGDMLFVPKGVLGKLQPMLDLLRFSVY